MQSGTILDQHLSHFTKLTHLLQACKYQEEYNEALAGFSQSAALDPTWSEPQEKEKDLCNYLAKVHELVKAKVYYSYFLICKRKKNTPINIRPKQNIVKTKILQGVVICMSNVMFRSRVN